MAGERLSEALKTYRKRYHLAGRAERSKILDEFCALTKYHRKYAITMLGRPADEAPRQTRRRGPTYLPAAIDVLKAIWEAASYPWSVRLKAMLPLWLPWARTHLRACTPDIEAQLLRISPRQIDRRLAEKKRSLKRRLYGKTKPGSLLKQQIAIRTENWDVKEAGFCEIDLVSHSGPHASGEFLHSLNLTDIHSGWSETRSLMGKGEKGVVLALDDIRRCLPFELKAIDSDNGSEFINYHLMDFCRLRRILFTRSRPYKKNDNAHIEQKNWTHVRRIFGWERYDSIEEQVLMNALYRGDLRAMMNFFQPCVKLISKERIGSRLKRYYDAAQTPLDRLIASGLQTPALDRLLALRKKTDPFVLSKSIEQQRKALEEQRRKENNHVA